ncbi:hypothetical protein MBLNU13_g08142t1 [Cladosporium sp. NU13]
MMKAINIRGQQGPAEALFIDEVPKPTLAPGDVLVQVKSFGLNRMDLSQRLGKYPVPPQGGPILGVECSGIAVEVSAEAADQFAIGDEVFGLTYGGAYAEYVAVQAGTLIHKPAKLSWEEAAAIPEAWMTVTQAMYLVGGFAAGKTILWHAGASSISIAGVQLSVARGAKATYITTSSAEKIEFCENVLGATKGFNYKEQDFSEAILEATGGRGVDIIVDFVGASHFQQNLDALAKDGTIVALAAMSGVTVSNLNISAFVRKRVSVRGSSLRSRDEAYQAELCKLFVKEVLPLIESGKLKLMIEKIYPWTETVEAHKLMESNQTKGKIICNINR